MPDTLIAPDTTHETRHSTTPEQHRKIAYIMSRFPKLTETFIIYEILALEEEGVDVEIYPLLRARNTSSHPEGASVWTKLLELFRKPKTTATMHPEAAPLVERARYTPLFSGKILGANIGSFLRNPYRYVKTLWTVIRANLGSMNYLAGGLAIFPKSVMAARQMQTMGVGHIHAHFANHPAAAAYIIHGLTGIPFSFTAHGADLQVDQHMLAEKVASANRVVTISQYNKDLIVNVCGEICRDKVQVVHCGVDTDVFQVTEKNDTHSQPQTGPFEFICIGTMYEVKGQRYLIEACRLLQERNIDFVCHLVGDGPDRDALEQNVREAGLSERVIFHGKLIRKDIVNLLKTMNALVLPSIYTQCGRREGIPVVLMEAMGSGLPVVASNISGIPELVSNEESGLLVPERDPVGIADAVERLKQDPELCRGLGKAAREKVLEEFDLKKNARKLRIIFEGRDA